jgi:hypothetical protein
MSDPRTKPPAQLPAPAPRPQLAEKNGPRLPTALAKIADGTQAKKSVHQFDKAFPVFITSARGLANGVGRNISAEGMFIETRDPCPIGSEIRITFSAPELATEFTAVAEVRFQAFLNFAGGAGDQEGLRGVGVRFVRFEAPEKPGNAVPQ